MYPFIGRLKTVSLIHSGWRAASGVLLRSPKNADRLLSALEWSKSRDEETLESVTVDEAIASLKQELEIGEEEKS